jgi:hypothetical protein
MFIYFSPPVPRQLFTGTELRHIETRYVAEKLPSSISMATWDRLGVVSSAVHQSRHPLPCPNCVLFLGLHGVLLLVLSEDVVPPNSKA